MTAAASPPRSAPFVDGGGVLEHPEASAAWSTFGLNSPPKSGGWVVADWEGGWTCCVEQGHYGHRARKATWLYVCRLVPPLLKWGRAPWVAKLDQGFHSKEERERFRAGLRQQVGVTPEERTRTRDLFEQKTGQKHFARLGTKERAATPTAFRDLLISIAELANPRTSERATP